MNKMGKFKILWVILLVLIVSACGVLGPRTFNEDGSEASPFSFEYPLGWEVLYDGESTWVFRDVSEIEVEEDGGITGFFAGTVGIGMNVMDMEQLEVQYGKELTLMKIMLQRENDYQVRWENYQNTALGETEEQTGLISLTAQPAQLIPEVYEPPNAYQLCDKELILMKSRIYTDFITYHLHHEEWYATVMLDGQLIQIVGSLGSLDEEEFEPIFEEVVCSLKAHERE